MTKDIDSFDVAGLEAVLAVMANDYIKSHCVEKNGQKFYSGDLHTLRWFQEYEQRQKEAYASKQTQITKGV